MSTAEQTRERLVDVATELFAERGYGAVGTEEIVARAGVTRGALYHHFRDKQDLFRAVFERLEKGLVASIASQMAGVEDPWDVLVTGVRAALDAATEPAVMRISLLDAPAVLGWREWRDIEARYGLGLVAAGLRNAMDQGVFREQEVMPLAHMLVGALSEASMLIADSADPASTRREVEPPLLALLAGLRSTDTT
jgi:AcrR family transcriptional regulator